ncbi:MAG: lysine--tRNA ligase [Deltaproteobacteria bacterium]|nr:lysine--tRNA ligase [Deltaproteobacteria bacterium]
MPDLNEQVLVRIEKVKKMREAGLNPFRNDCVPSNTTADLHAKYGEKTREELGGVNDRISVAGRVMAVRDFGKGGFLRIQDRKGQIQLFMSKETLGQVFENYKQFTDLGDIVYAEGKPFRTKTNELSVHVSRYEILTKAVRPLPEKFHGLADVELRYRHRSLDLIMSEQVRKTFITRTKIIAAIRRFFDARDFLEVDTPMMHSIAGGAAAKPFRTHHNALGIDLHMRIAPELHLKRLVVGGFERVYEMNRLFRNEGISVKHNPEFTSIEFYLAYATYEELMSLTEELFQYLGKEVLAASKLTYQGTEIDLSGPWPRLSVAESIAKYSGFKDGSRMSDRAAIMKYLDSNGIPYEKKAATGALLMAIFDEEVENHLIQPTFITHYPTDVSPLSRRNERNPSIVDRFELFVYGREIANAFSELNDPVDQRLRFELQAEAKAGGDEEACDIDEDFLYALEHGMPPTAGEGIGIDRLVMLFTDSASIRDVILFPQMRPQKSAAPAV